MAKFVVNVALIAAVLVVLTAWAVSSRRRRRSEHREHAAERRLILAAFTSAADLRTARRYEESNESAAADRSGPTLAPGPATQLDAASLSALLDILDDTRPARHGLLAGLLTSPRSVWIAGTRAGHNAARHTTQQPKPQPMPKPGACADLYRVGAAELVDIHSHDPGDAHLQYRHYVAAIGDPTSAELYLRAATYATYAHHDQVLHVVREITGTAPTADVSKEVSPRPPTTSALAHREVPSNHTAGSNNLDHA